MDELISQFLHELRSAIRFRWYGLLVIWAICGAGWFWVIEQPNIYQADARVYVDTSSILQPVLGNRIITPNVETELAYIREALLGRAELEVVARETGLDLAATDSLDLDRIIGGLQASINIQSVRGSRNSSDGIYSISYRHSDSAMAVAVVSAVLDNFVESTLGANQQQGDTTEQFLDDRVAEYEVRLAQAEQARANFQKENAGKLPGSQGGYFARIQAEREALDQAKRRLGIVQSERDELAAQLRGEWTEGSGSDSSAIDALPNSLAARIRDFELQLDSLLLQYTEKHPDVIATRRNLERLLEQQEAQREALESGPAGGTIDYDSNPIFRSIQMAINDTDVQIASLNAEIQQRTERVEELQGLIDEVPEVEAQLARLNRDYEVIYDQYVALVRSRETQLLTRKASDADQIDFRVINPPLASPTPVAPDRLLLLATVFVAALGGGAGLCYILGQLAPVFSSGASLRQVAGVPLLGVVSHAWPERRRARRRWSVVLFAITSSSVFVAFGVLVGIELLGPGVHQLVG